MQLGLGTVQFGSDYGVSNPGGRTPPDEVARILAFAEHEGIGLLDTAALYGDSEAVLGAALRRGHPFRIVSKTIKFDAERISATNVSDLRAGFEDSLHRLRQNRLYGLLVHSVADLLRPGGDLLWAALNELKRERLVEKIGVSVYTGRDIESVLARFRPDLVQLPLNVLDQRLLAGGQLARLKAKDIEVHARSIFLQGLLLMEDAPVPSALARFRPRLERVWQACRRAAVSPLALSLAFVKSVAAVDAAIVGVAAAAQLAQIVTALRSTIGIADFTAFACDEEQLLNPSLWNAQAG